MKMKLNEIHSAFLRSQKDVGAVPMVDKCLMPIGELYCKVFMPTPSGGSREYLVIRLQDVSGQTVVLALSVDQAPVVRLQNINDWPSFIERFKSPDGSGEFVSGVQ